MKKKFLGRLLTMLLVAAMVFTLLPASAIAAAEWWGGDEYADDAATQADETKYEYNIFFLDCGRKYYSVDSIKQFIDNASTAGFNYIQLAVGNDGLRFLLDDMSLTVNGTTYDSDAVKSAIHTGNEAYYNFDVDELTQSEMDTIIAYASSKGMGVIPCVNSPGHMDAILDAAEALTGKTCSYNGSARTIDVTNSTAVAFTQALLQKYITYFAGKGCQFFNMGADEYANDKYTSGSMGFGNLQSTGKYSYYVEYVNQVAGLIKNSGMTPMAFNDGIYFNNNTSSGTFDTNIIICYWSNGWDGYTPMPASTLASKGFKLINTDGSYYWVLGKSDWQCSASKASGFSYKEFQGSTIDKPAGSMFCVWADYPGAETEASVISKTSATIAAFGSALPEVSSTPVEPGIVITPSDGTASGSTKLDSASGITSSVTLSASEVVTWTWDPTLVNLVSADNTVNTYAATESLSAKSVIVTPVAGASGNAVITVTNDNGKTTDYTIAVYDSSAPEIADTITITVGGTATRTFTGDVRDTLKKDDLVESTATVSAEYKQVSSGKKTVLDGKQTMPTSRYGTATGVISDGTHYLVIGTDGSISSTTEITKATTFTVTQTTYDFDSYTQYSIYGGGMYLTTTGNGSSRKLSTSSSSDYWYYDSSKGFYRGNRYLTFSNSSWTISSNSGNGFLYSTKEVDDTPVYKTVVTFTGVAAGTTYVTIDSKLYKIVVTDKAPDGAMTSTSIDLEYWITNFEVYDGTSTSTNHTQTFTTSTAGAMTEEGIAIVDKAPDHAYSFFDGTKDVYYWQAMRLDADNQQTNASGDDETADGTTLTHIRYHGGAWQYKTADGIWHYFQSDDQLVAYYLQKTEVTKEVTTYVKDWGFEPGDKSNDNTDGGKVALSVAVVYPDGSVAPSEENILSATTIFNYWSGRDIGIVSPEINENYTISKITYTKSDGTVSGVTSTKWPDTSVPTWKKKDVSTDPENPVMWYDETVVWDEVNDAGTTPMLNAKKSDVAWDGASTGVLVLIYLKPVVKNTNLNIVYWNDADNIEIANGQVVVKEGVTYTDPETGIKQANPPTADGHFTLDDAAYISNSDGKPQTFNKNIVTVPNVDAKYRSGIYKYVGAEIADNGKTLILHYDIDSTKLKLTYVIDFALPVNIPLSDLVDNASEVKSLSVLGTDIISGTNVVNTTHGKLKYDTESKSIVFTPNAVFGTEKAWTVQFSIGYSGAATSKSITIGVVPASNVLYEESFLTKADGWTKGDSAAPTTAQETQKAKETKNVFGYDNAYVANNGNNVTGELGVWKADGLTTTTKTGALITSFYGNAFDLIGNCASDSGRVILYVSGNGTSRLIDIDTRYNGGTISQVPLAHIELGKADATYDIAVYASGLKATGLKATGSYSTQSVMRASSTDPVLQSLLNTYGLTMADVEYVSMSASTASAVSSIATYATAATVDHQKGTHVEIDGFRVYRSTTDSVAENYPDNEKNVTYKNILDVVEGKITAYTEINGNAEVDVANYEANGGPQNEIYLGEGQSVTFSVGTTQTAIQVSLRAVSGTAQWATSNRAAAGEIKDITSNTEMYYEVTSDANGSVTIANRGNTLLAIGNVKLPASVSTKSASEMDKTAVYESVCAAFATSLPVDPEPDQTVFVPEHFSIRNYATPLFRHKLVTLRIDFSKDVSYVEIDGQKYYPSKFASWFGYYTVTFTDTIGRNENYFYKVVFFDANGNPSETQSVYGK